MSALGPGPFTAVAMSGGLDSSVAAALLARLRRARGRALDAALGSVGEDAATGAAAGRSTSATRGGWRSQVGIPHYTLRLDSEFERQVIDALRRRLRRRPHAEPLRALQHLHQVRRLRRARAPARRRRGSPPATTRASSTAPRVSSSIAPPTSRRIRATSCSSSIRASSRRRCFPLGDMTKTRGARRGAPSGSGGGGEGREHGDLLRRRRDRAVPRRATGA